MGKRKPIAIDLFCGVGGMSLGFKQAGFRVIGAFDKEERHVKAYKRNFPSTPAYCVDLREETGQSLLKWAGHKGKVDVVFGGPPCQGFSMAGKRNLKDDRNLLIFDFIRLVRQIRPKYFVMENVQGLLLGGAVELLNSFLHRAHLAGYATVKKVRALNAADFGVPQRRKRVFVIGYRANLEPANYPAPTPIVDESGKSYGPTVWDAICDLPTIENHDALLTEDGFVGSLGKASHYGRIMRGEIKESSDVLRGRKRNGQPLTGCLRTNHSDESVARFRRTRPGTSDPISRFYRLDSNSVAPTIRAGTGNDHGSHMAPRPLHPEHPRCITVREAARLHSYPDWFQFDPTRWHAFREVGNSVPPRLARYVALEIVRAMKGQI